MRNPSTSVPLPLTLGVGKFVSGTTGRTLGAQVTLFKGAETSGTPLLQYTLGNWVVGEGAGAAASG